MTRFEAQYHGSQAMAVNVYDSLTLNRESNDLKEVAHYKIGCRVARAHDSMKKVAPWRCLVASAHGTVTERHIKGAIK
jgi:hypothetical protein